MDSITAFLQHIPDAATSPLAFVAYFLVVAAWTVRTWLFTNPVRHAKQILSQYKRDGERNAALETIFKEQPPTGLKGNAAILEWVRTRSAEKTRVLFVVAWLATILSILVFIVAVKNTGGGVQARTIPVSLFRSGTAGDCPSLPIPAHLQILSAAGAALQTVPIIEGCKATLTVSGATRGLAHARLLGAEPYEITQPEDTYDLSAAAWQIGVSQDVRSHLLISMFSYAGTCTQQSAAFDTFEQILRSKTTSLRGLFPAADKRYDYLSGLNINPVGHALDMSPQEVLSYSQHTGSLQVLSGLCFVRDGSEVMRSQIFSGALAGPLPEPLLADLPISPEEFGATRDIHTASILYALAREAEREKMDPDVVIAYLARARAIVAQIHTTPAPAMLRAIDQALEESGAPSPMTM